MKAPNQRAMTSGERRISYVMRLAVAGAALLLCVALAAGDALALSCSIQGPAPTLDFGTYDPYSPTPLDANSSFRLRCTQDPTPAVITVSLDGGQNFQAPSSRAMSSGGSLLLYNAYQDGARTVIWGDGAFGPTLLLTKTSKNESFDLVVYGRIPAGQNLPPGAYTDTITLTATYPDVSSPFTDTITVTSSIIGSCSFTTSGSIDFGGLDPVLAPAVVGAVTQPQVRCSVSMPYTVTDDSGLYEAVPGSPPPRLRDTTVNTNYIPYSISYTSNKTGTGASDPMDIAATIAAGSYAGYPAYTYDDVITFTVTW